MKKTYKIWLCLCGLGESSGAETPLAWAARGVDGLGRTFDRENTTWMLTAIRFYFFSLADFLYLYLYTWNCNWRGGHFHFEEKSQKHSTNPGKYQKILGFLGFPPDKF